MRALRTLAVCLVAATCARDAPVAPKPASDPATEQLTALATALTDAQQWLLPSLGERDAAIEAIAGRFTDLATSLARADTNALSSRIAAAREELEAANAGDPGEQFIQLAALGDRKSTRLNSSHLVISYAVFCLKKKKTYDRDRGTP